VFNGDAVSYQCILDQGAMAAPGHRLGAHQGRPFSVRPFEQFMEAALELGRQHVVVIPLEGGILPARGRGIGPTSPQTPEPWQMHTGLLQGLWEGVAAELRIT